MPAYNAAGYIERSLPPLVGMLHNNAILEVIVIDDGSTDETAAMAAKLGARVVSSYGQSGPGNARNLGANMADGDVLWFVDADVIVASDAVDELTHGLSEPGVVAVFGSYNNRPSAQNFLSQYKNLVHHYFHQHAPREATTFWTGCGAVRKDAFRQVGGFNADLRCVEDIDLGYRLLDAGGRILLLPDLQCTHLKEWRLLNLLCSDIFCRAIPWSRLMLTRTGLHNDLNVSHGERLRAALAGMLLIALISVSLGLLPWVAVIVAGVLAAYANRQLFAFFYRQKGIGFALRATIFHQFYYLYSTAAFVWSWIEIKILRLHPKGA